MAAAFRFSCPHCAKNFYHKNDYRKHLRTHTGEKPYACHYCPYRAAVRATLRYHVRNRHHVDLEPAKHLSRGGGGGGGGSGGGGGGEGGSGSGSEGGGRGAGTEGSC